MNIDKYFPHSRTAFKYALESLSLNKPISILMPDYICDVMIDPLSELNIIPIYYEINDDLSPNWKNLEDMVNDNVKCILMVHYFGKPQDIERFKSFCRKYKLLLIEDNCHGLGGKYRGKNLGSFGDISISSPRKQARLLSGNSVIQLSAIGLD